MRVRAKRRRRTLRRVRKASPGVLKNRGRRRGLISGAGGKGDQEQAKLIAEDVFGWAERATHTAAKGLRAESGKN